MAATRRWGRGINVNLLYKHVLNVKVVAKSLTLGSPFSKIFDMWTDVVSKNDSPGRLVRVVFSYPPRRGDVEGKSVEGVAFVPHLLRDFDKSCIDSNVLEADLEAAAVAIARLDGFSMQTSGGFNPNPMILYRPLRMREAILSSKIENTIASASEAALSEIEDPDRNEPREVANYFRAIEAGSHSRMALGESGIRGLHEMLLGGLEGNTKLTPGAYRDRQVFLGDRERGFTKARFVPPPVGEIPLLMHDLVEWLAQPDPNVSRLLMIGIMHYQFETIHPFSDGNGRLGRMLITLALCHKDLLSSPLIYPSGYINEHRQEYYDRLLAVSTKGDWTGWLGYYLRAISSEASDTLEKMIRLQKLRQTYLDRLSGRRYGQGILRLVDLLFERPALTPQYVVSRIGGSGPTARNYLEAMEKNGTLVELAGRRPKVYLAHEILSLVDEQ